jgi:dCMP deaminase
LIRLSWDNYFLEIAKAVALRSDCRRSQVGAVLADNDSHRILATGYVGVAPGDPGCLSGACPRGLKSYADRPAYSDYSDCISTHAEQNCFDYAVRWYGDSYPYHNTTMYSTRRPCEACLNYCTPDIRRFVFLSSEVYEYLEH